MASNIEERFMNLVIEHPFSYDKSDASFKSAAKKNKAWQEIGAKFGISGDGAQKQFKSLREKYIRIKKEYDRYERSGAGAYFKTKWHLFDIMKFLDEVVKPRKYGGECACVIQTFISLAFVSRTTSNLTWSSCTEEDTFIADTQDSSNEQLVCLEIDTNVSQEELLDLNIMSSVSNIDGGSNETFLLKSGCSGSNPPSVTASNPMSEKQIRDGQKGGTSIRSTKKHKLEEKFSETLDALSNNLRKEMPTNNYINAFCTNLEQELLQMPQDVMEDFKDEITELLLKKRRIIRNNK